LEITNRIGQRALTYVAAVASQGYDLSLAEFETYVSMPMPEVRSPFAGRVLERATDNEPEPILEWLVRLGWLARQDGKVGITQLGRAVLRSIDQAQLASDLPPDLALGPPEPLAYGPILGRLGELRDVLLVDRTLQFDQFLEVVMRTQVTRILVGADPQHEAERRRLAAALARPLGIDRPLFIGVSPELGDRMAIPPSGAVVFLAGVRTAAGHRHSMVGSVEPPAADAIRQLYDEIWARSRPLTADPTLPRRERPSFVGRSIDPLPAPERDRAEPELPSVQLMSDPPESEARAAAAAWQPVPPAVEEPAPALPDDGRPMSAIGTLRSLVPRSDGLTVGPPPPSDPAASPPPVGQPTTVMDGILPPAPALERAPAPLWAPPSPWAPRQDPAVNHGDGGPPTQSWTGEAED
jgi:hypothetical protein